MGSGEKAGRNVLENFRPALTPEPTDRPWVSKDVETGTRNCCVIEATHVSKESLGKIKFRAFPKRVGPRILSLESVDYFGTSKHYGTLLSGDRKNN